MRNLLQWLIDHAEAREEERAQARDLLDQAHPPEAATESPAAPVPPVPVPPPPGGWATPGVAHPEGGSQL